MFSGKECRNRAYIVAELSANHCGCFQRAVQLISAAYWSGADIVKVQMFKAEQMTLDRPDWVVPDGLWKGKKLFDLYKEAETPYDWIPILKQLAEKMGLGFFTSVYHPDTVDIAEQMGMEAYKVSSFELNYTDLLVRLGQTNKPVLLSTGGSSFTEIFRASRPVRKKVWLMHCISSYPAVPEEMNLRTIYELSRYCSGRVGISDHSAGSLAPAIATTMGARIIEKHLTLDEKGLDAGFSMKPHEFKQMVQDVRIAEKMTGKIQFVEKKTFHRTNVDGIFVRKPHKSESDESEFDVPA